MSKYKETSKDFSRLYETDSIAKIHKQEGTIDKDLQMYKYLSDIKHPSYYSLWKGSFTYLISDIKK